MDRCAVYVTGPHVPPEIEAATIRMPQLGEQPSVKHLSLAVETLRLESLCLPLAQLMAAISFVSSEYDSVSPRLREEKAPSSPDVMMFPLWLVKNAQNFPLPVRAVGSSSRTTIQFRPRRRESGASPGMSIGPAPSCNSTAIMIVLF